MFARLIRAVVFPTSLAAAALITPTTSVAQTTNEFALNGSNLWSTATNWVGGIAPSSTYATNVIRMWAPTSFRTRVDVSSGGLPANTFLLHQLNVSNQVSSFIGGNTLRFTNNGVSWSLFQKSGGGALTVSNSIELASNLTFENTAATNGVVTNLGTIFESGGSFAITNAGAGTNIFTGTNTYSGGTFITGGALELRSTNSAGSGAITLTGGTLALRNNNAIRFGTVHSNIGYTVNLAGSATIDVDRVSGTGTGTNLSLGTLNVTGGNRLLTVRGGNSYGLVFNGPVNLVGGNLSVDNTVNTFFNDQIISTGNRSLTKTNSGSLFYNSDSVPQFTGGLVVAGGVVQWNYGPSNQVVGSYLSDVNTNVGFGSGTITLSGGTMRFAPNSALTANQDYRLTNAINVTAGSSLVASQTTLTNSRFAPNAGFTGQITLANTLTVGSFDTASITGAQNIQYEGRILVDGTGVAVPTVGFSPGLGTARGITYTKSVNSRDYYDADLVGPIADNPVNLLRANALVLNGGTTFNGQLNIAATNNTYAGGTVINGTQGGGVINVAAGSSLGAGDVWVNGGGRLRLNSAGNLAAGRTVSVYEGGLVGFGSDTDLSSLISPSATGVLGIDHSNFTTALDMGLVGAGRFFLGSTLTNGVYSAATLGVGANSIYRLGGGAGGLTLQNGVLTGAASVEFGGVQGNVGGGLLALDPNQVSLRLDRRFSTNTLGTVTLNASNDYSGTTLINGGTVLANAAGALGTNALTLAGGTLIISATNAYTGVAGIPVVPSGASLATLVNGTASPFGNSNVTVNVYGTLAVAGPNGTLVGLTNLALHPTSLLLITNSAADGTNANRLADDGVYTLNSSTLRMAQAVPVGAANTTNTEKVGTLIFNGGSLVTLQTGANPSNSTARLVVTNLVRGTNMNGGNESRGTLVIQRTDSGTGAGLGNAHRFIVGSGPATNFGMISPFIVLDNAGGGPSFAATSVDPDGSLLTPATFTRTILGGNNVNITNLSTGNTNIVFISSNSTLTGAVFAYAMRIGGNITNTANSGTNQINISSGGLIVSNNGVIAANFVFGTNTEPREGLVYVNSGNSPTFTGQLIASNLTKFGAGTLVLSNASQAYSNGWNINQGALRVDNVNALGTSVAENFVNLNGGVTLHFRDTNAAAAGLSYRGGTISLFDFGNVVQLETAATDRTNSIPDVRIVSQVAGQGASATLRTVNSRNALLMNNLSLHDHTTLTISNQSATGNSGFVGVTNLMGTNVTLTKLGGGNLTLMGDNSANFIGSTNNISQGAVRFLHANAFGDANSVVNVGSNAVFVIGTNLVGYATNATLARVNQLAGSGERWEHALARFTDNDSAEIFNVGTNVHLQLATDLQLTNKALRLNGGTLEAFLANDSTNTAVTNVVGSGVTIALDADSRIGRSTADSGRAAASLAIDAVIVDGTNGTRLAKIGGDTIFLRTNNTYSGGTAIRGGTLVANGAASAGLTNALGTGAINLAGGTLSLRANEAMTFGSGSGYEVYATDVSTLNVDRIDGATSNLVTSIGSLKLTNANITISAANNYALGVRSNSVFSDSTINVNNATNYFYGDVQFSGTNRLFGNRLMAFGGSNSMGLNAAIYSGNSGTLVFSNQFTLNGTNTIRNSQNVLFNGVINEALAGSVLVKEGTSTLLLTNLVNNTYTGGTILRAGNLQVAGNAVATNGLGIGPVSLEGGTLQLRADDNLTFGPGSGYALNVVSNATINLDRIANTTSSNKVLSIGAINSQGGALTVSSANGYILGLNDNAIWSNSTINATAQLLYNGTVNAFATNSINGTNAALGGYFLNGAVTLSNSGTLVMNGTIANGTPAGSLIKTGAGTMVLTNTVTNLYTGGTEIRAGTLRIAADAFRTNLLGGGTITLAGGTLDYRTDARSILTNNLVVVSNSAINTDRFIGSGTGITNVLGNVSLGAMLGMNAGNSYVWELNQPITLTGNGGISNAGTVIVNGNITDGASTFSLTKLGSGALQFLTPVNRTYDGGTFIYAGTLRAESSSGATRPLGTGAVTMYGGILELRDGGNRTNGNDLIVAGTNANAVVNVNRTGNTAQNVVLSLGGLTMTNGASFQVEGGNNFVLRFTNGLALGSPTNLINVTNARNTAAYSLEIQGPLVETVAGARLVKSGGAQELGYTSTAMPNHSGGTEIRTGSGALTWRPSNLLGGTYGFGTGDIFLNSGVFRFQNNVTSNYFFTNNIDLGNSVSVSSGVLYFGGATLDYTSQGGSPRVTNTGAISMGGQLIVTAGSAGAYGSNNYAASFTGPITLVGDNQTLHSLGSGGGSDDRIVFYGNVGSDNGQRALTVSANNSAKIEFTGTNSGLAGMHVARSFVGNVGAVLFDSTNALPASRVTVAPGAAISVAQQNFLTGANTNFAAISNWFDLANGSIVVLHSTNRATSFSQDYNGLIDLSATGLNRDLRIGALEGYTITTTNSIVPYADVYKLGAGAGAFVLNRTNQLTGGNRLEIGSDPGFDANEIVAIANSVNGTLRLQQSNNYTGGTIINQGATAGVRNTNVFGSGDVQVYGVLSLEAANGRATTNGLTNLNAFILHPTSTLQFENNDAIVTNRFGDSEAVVLNGGVLRQLGRNAAGVAFEYVNDVQATAGGRIQLDGRSSGSNVLHLGSITRGMSFSGITNGTIQIVANLNNLLGLTNRILVNSTNSLISSTNGMVAPWIVNQSTGDYLTYNANVQQGYVVGLTNFSTYRVGFSGAVTGDVVNITSTTPTVLGANTSIYALRLGSNTRITNSGGTDITLLSGGLLAAGNTTNDANLIFRDGDGNPIEALIYSSGTLRLAGTNQARTITKFGDGTLQIGTTQSNYAGGWSVNRGTLDANLATGSVGTGGTNYAFGNSDATNFINLNGNATLRFTTVATNQVYSSGKITSWDNNLISSSFGAQDDRRIFIAPNGLDLNSISNGSAGTQLRVELERTRSEMHVVGAVTLNANTIFNIRDTGTANGSTGSTNRFMLDGGLMATNRVVVKYGNGVLELPGDNSTTSINNTVRVTGGALAVGHNGSFGDASSTVLIASNAILELNAGLTNFVPIASVTQSEGSAERWLGQYNRFTDDATPQTYSVPTNVTVQLASRLYTNANQAVKTIRLQGGGLESYQFNGDNRSQNNTNLFNVEFTGNLRLGQSGIDVGRAGLVSVFQGNFSEVNSGLSLSKVGIDTIVLTGTANHTGGTFVNGGTLRLSRAATNNTTLLTDGIAGNTDVTINGGILEIGASEQIADNAGVVLNTNGTFQFNGSGRIETVGSFRNNGGTFISGANTLDVTGNTIEWFGGVNTISSGGLVRDQHVVITGGQNAVEGGGVLDVTSGAGTAGLIFGGTGSPNITLNSSAATAGSILLSQNVTVSNSVNGASITSGGSLANPGFIDLQGGTRTFTVEDGSATQDLTMGVQLQNGGFIKAGSGRMTLTRASTITGNVTVNGGTLELSADGALAAPGQIQINTGGTLLIGGGSGNTIGNSVPVVLNGGTLNSGGLSETLGTLTLSANSTLNMGSGASILNFANSSGQTWAGGTTLLIQNWSGVSQAEGGSGGGIDQLIFGTSSSALTAGQLSQIKFQFDWGQSDAIMLTNGEVIAAVPEPATVIAILALVGLVSYHERRRLVALFRRLRA